MRYLFIFVTCMLLAGISSCKKSRSEHAGEFKGSYKGTFEHMPSARPKAQISLDFSNGSYTGSSNQTDYVDVCSGTYVIEGHKITFTDQCLRVAFFPSVIILNGVYDLERNGDTIQIIKSFDNGLKDIYVLVKQ